MSNFLRASVRSMAQAGSVFLRANTLKPKGFQASAKSQWQVAHIFCPAPVPLLSRSLSRWVCWRFSGLGGLSRCPAQTTTRMYTRTHMRKVCGTTGQRDILSCSYLFYSNINKIDNNTLVPLLSRTCPVVLLAYKNQLNMGGILT